MKRSRRTVRASGGRRARSAKPTLFLVAVAGVVVLAGSLLAAAGWLGRGGDPVAPASGPAPVAANPAGRPALRLSSAVYDLGQVSQARGVVTVEVGIANAGEGDLVIQEMETSCGCTRAALIVDGRPGPWFGMRGHAEWPTGWTARLRPGQRAVVQIQYDPDAHGIYRGPIDRLVLIHSNDPRDPRARVRLTGTQVP